jgi:hypothetical protein
MSPKSANRILRIPGRLARQAVMTIGLLPPKPAGQVARRASRAAATAAPNSPESRRSGSCPGQRLKEDAPTQESHFADLVTNYQSSASVADVLNRNAVAAHDRHGSVPTLVGVQVTDAGLPDHLENRQLSASAVYGRPRTPT